MALGISNICPDLAHGSTGSGLQSPRGVAISTPAAGLSSEDMHWSQASFSWALTPLLLHPHHSIGSAQEVVSAVSNMLNYARARQLGAASLHFSLLPPTQLQQRSAYSMDTASHCPAPMQLPTSWKLCLCPDREAGSWQKQWQCRCSSQMPGPNMSAGRTLTADMPWKPAGPH